MTEPNGPPQVPPGWTLATVEELAADETASLTDGPFGSNLKTSHYTDAGPRVIRLQNIGDGQFVDEAAHISEAHFEQLRRHEAIAADVVVAMLGEVLPRACVVPDWLGAAIVKADCARLRVHSQLTSGRYVVAALTSQRVRAQAAELVHGVGRPRLGLGRLKTLRVPIAPVNEQVRIVAAIESYFSRLDDAVASLERVQANMKRYRASVLKAAVEGRLVPTEAELARAEGRDYEPASVLLERILVERRRRWEEAEAERAEFRGERGRPRYGEPLTAEPSSTLPEGWAWCSLDQLVFFMVDNRGRTPPDAPDGIPIVSAANVKRGAIVVDKLRFVSPDVYRQYSRGECRPGDLILTTEAPVGEVALYPTNRRYLLTRRVIGFRTADVDNRFLRYCFESDVVRSHLAQHNRGTTVPRILKPALLKTPIPLPPRDEQRRIVEAVERSLSLADRLSSLARSAEHRSTRLRQSILKWAFEGKLVHQDPTDEPASVLVERIRTEREAAAATKQPTRRKRRSKETTE